MEPIDTGFAELNVIRDELPDLLPGIVSEEDTRMKVITRILQRALGWPLTEIFTEEPAGDGFLDYKLSVNGMGRVVVEAKRDGRELGFENANVRPYRLNGPMFKQPAVKEGLAQAISYAAYQGCEVGVLTNGREWVIFRANRLGDGKTIGDGFGFVFPNIDAVAEHFKLFWELMSYDSAFTYGYRSHFLEAEGSPVRSVAFKEPVRKAGEARLLKSSELASDIRVVMSRFFTRLSGDQDPELLAACFVESRESREADRKLVRISEDLVGHVREMDDATGAELVEMIRISLASAVRDFVILIGTKGAGKSTFIDRFFKQVLPSNVSRKTVHVTIDLRDHPGDRESIVPWLKRRVLEALESALNADRPLTYDELRGMFFDEYLRLREGAYRHLYQTDPQLFRTEFGKHLEEIRAGDPDAYIQGLLRHVLTNRKHLPVIVFDNADHFTIEFQEAVYQYARSVHAKAASLTILPITDRTSWQLSRQGALQSFEHEALFLPTPSMRSILQRRITYLVDKIAAEERAEDGRYFTERGIRLSLPDLAGFVASLEGVLLRSPEVSDTIANLSNNDVRRALQITGELMSSPHIPVSRLVGAHLSGSSSNVPLYLIERALVLGRYDIYPEDKSEFVRNMFALSDDVDTSPLLGLRLLRLLQDAPEEEHVGKFLHVSDISAYMTAMQFSLSAVNTWLDAMLKSGLCWAYDPTISTVYESDRVEISPSGVQHLRWATSDYDYVRTMALVSPLRSPATHKRLSELQSQPIRESWFQTVEVFIDYLLNEDSRYCSVGGHEAYSGQLSLEDDLKSLSRQARRDGQGRLARERQSRGRSGS